MTIKGVAMDVDGVLTDGTVSIDEAGQESKRISFADIMGLSIGRKAGLSFALVSGEGGPLLDAIASKLGVTEVYPNCKDKALAIRAFAQRNGFDLSEVCYIGDDVNDVPAFEISGLAVAPASAQTAASTAASLVTVRSGGAGSVREVIDTLLAQ